MHGCLICVSRIARTFLIYPTSRCCAFYGLHDYFCLHGLRDHFWWELLDSFHDNGHPDHVQLIDVTWVDAVDLSLRLYTIQQQAYDSSWFQWAATVWMHVMLSLKDSRHGLSSIYSFFLHFEKSATFGTVGCSKVFYGNTQWNFSLCWFCLNLFFFSCRPHPCMRWRCSLLRCLQRRGGWRLQAMRSWRIQQAQTNSAFFKFTALFVRLRMCFVWLWTGPQESKGVHKLVLVASQIFLLTLAQLFCRSLTSRSQVTLSMVTLLLISQWLRHLFRWANASASDYLIISPLLHQLYMLDQLLRTECEEEREAWFLFFDWRSSLTTPIGDCTRLYAFMRRFNWQSSLRVYHSNTNTFRWCGAEASRADEVRQLACLPEFVQIQENPGFLWVSQTIMPEFSSLRFSCLNFPLSGFLHRCNC